MYMSWVWAGGSAPPVMLRLMLNSEREILAPSEVTEAYLANTVSKCTRPDLGIGVEADRGLGPGSSQMCRLRRLLRLHSEQEWGHRSLMGRLCQCS